MAIFPEENDGEAEAREQAVARLRKRSLVLGVSLLARDRARLPWLLLAIFLPQVLPEIWSRHIGGEILGSLGSRVIALVILWSTLRRHLADYEMLAPPRWRDGFVVVATGVALWLGWWVPIALQGLPVPTAVRFALIAMTIAGIHAQLRFFFFFVEPSRGVAGVRNALQHAIVLSQKDFWLPVFTLLLPFTLSLLLSGLVSVPSPDGRFVLVDLAARFATGIFWLLFTYLSVGAALVLSSSATVTREEDVTSSPPWSLLAAALRPQVTASLFFLAVLVWAGNFMQLLYLPPAAEVRIAKTVIEGSTVKMTLFVQDERFHLRGFIPLHFALGSENRVLLSGVPTNVTSPLAEDARFGVPRSSRITEITLDFETDRAGPELQQLEDVYLWYRYVKLFPVLLKDARVEPVSPVRGESS